MSIFAVKKEGNSFVNYIQNDNIRLQVADASGIKIDNDNKNKSGAGNTANIPMDKSILDIYKENKKSIGKNYG